MARTAEGLKLTEAHRQIQAHVATVAIRDLLHIWALVNPDDVRGSIDPFARAGVAVVKTNRRLSALAAQRYYTAFRQVEGVPGSIAVPLAPDTPDEVITGALKGGALAGIVNAVRRGQPQAKAMQNGFVKLSGSASALVVGGGRDTIADAIQSDDAAEGWQRVTDGDPCAFCAMIASQGIIAKDSDSAGFEAHGHCLCTAEPAFEGSQTNPANERFAEAWQGATQGLSGGDALNAFRRSMAAPPSTTET